MQQEHPDEFCPNCGARMKEFYHLLSPGLVNVLVKAIRFVKSTNTNKFHLHDLGLTQSEYCNAQKLRFHGLIAHADPENLKAGQWLITSRGGQFLRSEISVPHRVKTYRNEVIDHDPELVHMDSFRGVTGYFESEFDFDIHEGKVIPALPKNLQIPLKMSAMTSISTGLPLH